MNTFSAFLSGLVFGCGLIVAGMADPAKVLAFLDVAGLWDPSLLLVMGGAIGIAAVGFAWAIRRDTSVLGEPLRLPSTRNLDLRLVCGSALFGIGWGLAGICPGPALLLAAQGKALSFLAAMLIGMVSYEILERRRREAC